MVVRNETLRNITGREEGHEGAKRKATQTNYQVAGAVRCEAEEVRGNKSGEGQVSMSNQALRVEGLIRKGMGDWIGLADNVEAG